MIVRMRTDIPRGRGTSQPGRRRPGSFIWAERSVAHPTIQRISHPSRAPGPARRAGLSPEPRVSLPRTAKWPPTSRLRSTPSAWRCPARDGGCTLTRGAAGCGTRCHPRAGPAPGSSSGNSRATTATGSGLGRPRRRPGLAVPVLGDQRPDHLRHAGHLVGGQVEDLAERLVPAPAPGRGHAVLQPAAVALVLQPARHRAQLRVADRARPRLFPGCSPAVPRRACRPGPGEPPRADPAARSRSLLEHAVPGQLAQVE